ncbi:hypothetical protein TRFO_02402 [Tritrichomonas foetus]|uniref:Uncharacterized protein n=1 Tax=Tritrichomonas foetus TaxID=1144522 RepID=A0A1J4J3D1_9EUKA|nr:hypothetical protein TRFO_02402 [Tritrichomonas foetus]|eukprot:OHS93866.1 hypothetical protein TRFO_02402 [Tritrichomonas foetus]
MILYHNATISNLALHDAGHKSLSPIFFLPVISALSTNNFYNIRVSKSFSHFLYGTVFKSVYMEKSQFSHFLATPIKTISQLLTCPVSTQTQKYDGTIPDVQLVLCNFSNIGNGPGIYSVQNSLRLFTCNFYMCLSDMNGGGVHHENGYFSSNAVDYTLCSASNLGGGFYHINGELETHRSSFNQNKANNYTCFYASNVTTGNIVGLNSIPFSKPAIPSQKLFLVEPITVMIYFSFCSFQFPEANVSDYIGNPRFEFNQNTNKFDLPETNYTNGRKEPSMSFSPSDIFTESSVFSQSIPFTATTGFTQSEAFTVSSIFSFSFIFTDSSLFTASTDFTSSIVFTESSVFTFSSVFTVSTPFTQSGQFTVSSAFTPSSAFTASSGFTASESFTPNQSPTASISPIPTRSPFPTRTPSQTFTQSNPFTRSDPFTASLPFPTQSIGATAAITQSPNATEEIGATASPVPSARVLSLGPLGILMIIFGILIGITGIIANMILCVKMMQSGEIIITQRL